MLAQDTGIKEVYPNGRGLLFFASLEEALIAAEEVSRNYAVHAHAARKLAEEHFDSNKVLSALVAKLDAG